MFSPAFTSSFPSYTTSDMEWSPTTNESSFLSPKLTLDMSFNRNPEGQFASDVDPLEQVGDYVPPQPTFPDIESEVAGLDDAFSAWKFPLRTDFARGIIWGPFRHCRGNSYAELAPEFAIESARSYADHSMAPARPQAPVRRQRIFPILRTPSPETVSLSASVASSSSSVDSSSPASSISSSSSSNLRKSSSKRRRRTTTIITRTSRPSRAAAIKATKLQQSQSRYYSSRRSRSPRLSSSSSRKKSKFVHVAIALPIRRIRLCATSQLKYTDL
ncbi:hypothetical protein MJO28_011516 [Puccinia striiformis f. sp. tritici]|uniref:Uncharacterized protein n=1 Tax=Puccinia striiformis f. sp. tritici TaxID=168172 RepID=A0ACC0E5E3_9BASI|nr:hypothetical protein MJO28_011516 [Puccinia striiformis f. sp. tritici]